MSEDDDATVTKITTKKMTTMMMKRMTKTGGLETDEDVKDFLQKRGELLIKKGEWVDFEGREDFEWTEENFAQLELDQKHSER